MHVASACTSICIDALQSRLVMQPPRMDVLAFSGLMLMLAPGIDSFKSFSNLLARVLKAPQLLLRVMVVL